MKKYFGLCALLLFVSVGHTETIKVDLKIMDLLIPFQETNTSYLYDIKFERSMIGLDTPILASKDGRQSLVVGGAYEEDTPDTDADRGLLYVGFDVDVTKDYFKERFKVGGWVSHDFKEDEIIGGLKASIKLWGGK